MPAIATFGNVAARGSGFGLPVSTALTRRFLVGISAAPGVVYCDNLTTWTNATGFTGNEGRYLAFGPNSVVGANGSNGVRRSVNNGVAWTVVTISSPAPQTIYSASYAGNAFFLGLGGGAAGDGVNVLRSTDDGATFTKIVIAATLPTGTDVFAMVKTSVWTFHAGSASYNSADGVTGWTQNPAHPVNFRAVSASGAAIIALPSSGAAALYYSIDAAQTWALATVPGWTVGTATDSIAFANGLFFLFQGDAARVSTYWTSPDGVNWTQRTGFPAQGATMTYAWVAYSGDGFMVVNQGSGSIFYWATSPTGIDSWTSRGSKASWPYCATGYTPPPSLLNESDFVPDNRFEVSSPVAVPVDVDQLAVEIQQLAERIARIEAVLDELLARLQGPAP
jgi:hypothetical protein